jgi:hypothetical protein
MQQRTILALLFATFTLNAAPIDWIFQTPVMTIQPGQTTVIYDTLPVSSWAAQTFDLAAVEAIPEPDTLNSFWLISQTLNFYPGTLCLCVNMGDDAIRPAGTEMWTTSYLTTGVVYELVVSAAPETQFELNPQLFGNNPVDPPPGPPISTVPEPSTWIVGMGLLVGVLAVERGRRRKERTNAAAINQG